MAERSTGPVKPPVIDLTARNANARPEERADQAGAAAAPSRGGAARPAGWPLLGGVAVAGALLGTALTYLAATLLPLPARGPDLAPQVTAQGDRLDALAGTVSALQQTTTRTQVSLDATIAQLDTGLTGLNQAVAEVRAAIPEMPAPVDLGPLETQLRTLRAQVDAIAAGASGADAGAIAASIASVETNLSSLTTRLNGVDATVTALRTDLDAARTALSTHIDAALPNETGPALKLPLILSGLEGAFATGRPFATELETLRTVLPDFPVPGTLAAAARTGLVRPDALLQRFEAALPDILAARDTSSGDWVQGALDWTKGMLALRPAGEMDGDSPEAIVSRLEAAMERRDYGAARGLIEALPQPMQDKAALVAADIRAQAEAAQLVVDLRARALATAAPAP